ncbi:uncharacterized protein LOC115226600 [Octopus sinensis]|uniref:Uncharacterized protein LOC115226600 n=1 Tax=Octopus sinensis TaxID=2607531 RepID=A0A6P7TN44_9MOLL|nr:uncharacterized protein LOC115226600 [Octopus sinensis]XP_036371175.1 uncharacterized protein LOC115226600 [Octopus sinensis]XP_036371176.1 uncharacterized protein LOC115226600 [Octopus sinensis]
MEDKSGNTSRRLASLKRSSWGSTSEREEDVYHKKCRYWRDDGSRREVSQKRSSSQPTTKQKRHKGDDKNWEIIRKRDILDKRVYYTRFNAYEDKINLLINSREEICTFLKSIGMDENTFLKDFTQRIEILQKDIKEYDYSQDFVIFANLECFLEQYVKTNVFQDKHKTIEAPKIINKFRPHSSVVNREAKIEESGEDLSNPISNIVVIQGGIVTYSRHCMSICCVTRDGNRNDVHCSSSVTDFTRISEDTVLATLPFQKMILIINPLSLRIKRIQLGLILVSYLEHSTLMGVELFGRTIYVIDWEENRIKYEFITQEIPTDIAVGAQNKLLVSFSNINRVTCYNVDGQQLFGVDTNSLDIPSHISVYQNHFYVLQGHIIYRISGTGAVTTREIGMKCRHISVGKKTFL